MKPFVKWAGGKRRLLHILEAHLPPNIRDISNLTYIEPFVGGGAMLFHMLRHYPNISRVIINDKNENLIQAYVSLRDFPEKIADCVEDLFSKYLLYDSVDLREKVYYTLRDRFNNKEISKLERTALFIFLNRTCFNGLYRENNLGKFNVPHGKYKFPSFLDRHTVRQISQSLQHTDILCGDFENVIDKIDDDNAIFAYIDPPYRPENRERNIFTGYNSGGFSDADQERVKLFCDRIHALGGYFMVSNSDSQTEEGPYFDNLYHGYSIEKFKVKRTINPYNSKDLTFGEIIIKNY